MTCSTDSPRSALTRPRYWLNVADADLSSAVLSWMIARPDGIEADRPAQQRVGMRDVRAIRDAAATFMQLDFKYGGGHGHRALRHYFRYEVLPLLNVSYSAKVGTALFGAAAEVSQLLAWTAYDTGNHRLAHRYLTSALRLSQVIDDRMFGARILGNLSHQANYLGNHAQAIQQARCRRRRQGRATHAPWRTTRPWRRAPCRTQATAWQLPAR